MMETSLSRMWWVLALRGFLAIVFGVLAFLWPGITLTVLVLMFGAYALVDGVFAIAAAVSGQTGGRPWWGLVLEGLVGIAAAAATVLLPGITALTLLYLIA